MFRPSRENQEMEPLAGLARKVATGLVFAVAIYVLLHYAASEQNLVESLLSFPPGAWVAVLLLSLLNYTLRSARFHAYLTALNQSASIPASVTAYIAGFALTATPGKVGEAYRCVLLDKRGVAFNSSLSACFFERLVDIAVVAILASALLFELGFMGVAAGLLIVGLVLGVIYVARLDQTVIQHLLQKLLGNRFTRMRSQVATFISNCSVLLESRNLLIGGLLGLVAWVAEGVGLAIILDAFDTPLPVIAAVGIYATAMLVGAASMLPGGLGSAEAAMVILLNQSGVPLDVAAAATLICRIATLWFAILLGALAIPIFSFALQPKAARSFAE